MAKASLLRRIVNTVKRVFSGGGGGGGSQRRVTNNRDSRRVTSSNTSARRAYINAYKGERDDLERDSRKDSWEKTRNAFKASSSKATTDPKEELRRSARENRKKETKDWYKATNQRYNVSGAKDKAEELKRRQAVKSRAFDADTAVAEQKHAMKYHKNAESFARGAVSGATFGASDLLAKYGTKGEAKKAENVYQKNKNKTAEAAGEVAGNLAAFGLTSGASKAVVKKALPRTTKFAGEQGAKVAGKLAGTKLVRKAAEKEVANAVKKGLAKEVTEEAVERVAKQKAKETVANLAEDAAINLTTGKVDSVVRAIKDTKGVKSLDDLKDSKVRREVEKNFLKNDVANVGIGSVATVGLPAVGKGIKRAFGGVSEGAKEAITKVTAKELAERAAKNTDNALERVDIRNMARKAEPPKVDVNAKVGAKATPPKSVDDAVSRIRSQMDEAHDIARDVRRSEEERFAAADKFTKLHDELEKAEASARGETPIRNQELHEYLTDDIVPYNEKYKAYQERIDGIAKESDDLEERLIQGDEAAQARINELVEERRQLNADLETARGQSDGTAKSVENVIDNEQTVAPSRRTVNEQIQSSLDPETRAEFTQGTERTVPTPEEAQELKDSNWRTSEEHTKQGGATIAAGMGDEAYLGSMQKAIDDGDLTIEVYHDKENYEKGAQRVLAYANGEGGKTGKQNLESLVERFTRYADGDEPITSKEARDMLYDVLAAVDYANTLAKDEATKQLGEDLFLSATKAGAELTSVSGLSLRQWQKIAMSSPDYRTKAVKQQIEIMFNSSRGFRKKFGKLEGGMKKLRDGTPKNDGSLLDNFIAEHPEDCAALQAELDNLMGATSAEEVEDAASHVLIEARKVMPVTAFDQLTQWRYVAMLSSPTTHIKNIVGNIYSGTLGQTSGAIASSIENYLKKSGKVSDDYLKSSKGFDVTARNDATIGVFEGLKLDEAKAELKEAQRELNLMKSGDKTALEKKVADLEAKVATAQKNFDSKKVGNITGAKAQELYHSKSKEHLIRDAEKWVMSGANGGGKALEKASDFLGKALETSDAVAVERIYRETADKVLQANDYERWLKLAEGTGKEAEAAKAKVKQIEEYAAQHAAYKASLDTYRNYNAVANWMNKTIKNTLYNADAKWYKKAGGFTLHAVMPFTKVPTNIMKRSIDYSPVGLIQGKKMLNKAIASGDYAEINKAVERLSEGLIGTGIASLGLGMGALDPDGMTITTRLDRKSELDKMKKDRGYMDYSLRVGNKDFTLEWATPTASTFFVGVEIGRMLRKLSDNFAAKNDMDFDLGEALGSFGEIMTKIIEPNLQLSMFQGVNSILEDTFSETRNEPNVHPIFTMGRNIADNYVSSMMPSIVGRLSKAFSPYDYFVSGDTNFEYRKNLMMSKVPILSKQKFDARTNAWGEIRNEKKDAGDYLKAGAISLLSPMNVSNITMDDTDMELYKIASENKDFDVMPKNFYGTYDEDGKFTSDVSFGRNKDSTIDIKMSNNDKAQYNIARGKAGEDAMTVALESVMFNRRTKDEKGHSIPRADAYTDEQKAQLIGQFKGKSAKDVVEWVMKQPEFKDATPKEQAHVIKEIVGNGDSETSKGAKRTSELTVAKRHGVSEDKYDYKNEVTDTKQKELDPLISAGVLTYKQIVDFNKGAAKTGYYENESGGYSSATYNQENIMNYLATADLSDEAKKALYDTYYMGEQTYEQALAKQGKKGKSGRRRRGGYRRRRGGGGSSTVKTSVPIKASDYKASKATYKNAAEGLKSRSSSKKKTKVKATPTVKVEPPKVKMKKYTV